MEYCTNCNMPKLERGLDRCYCEPVIYTTTEDEDEASARRLLAETYATFQQKCWLAPIQDLAELKNLSIDPASLPVCVYCIETSRVYDNDGRGWTYIDDDGFTQNVVLVLFSYDVPIP